MKKLKCKDLDPSKECEFEAEGETNNEVINKMYAHAQEVHADKLASMSDEDKAAINTKMTELLDAQN